MKRAFTLIELLVVIAIIAILAAILFPVFAQAKTAAKKTAAISNQKQISLGTMMYMGDNDDMYPKRGGCEANSSLNPALNDGTLRCSNGPGFAHSMTWQTWQKYVIPYIKSIDLFTHPLRQRDATEWNRNGQILNSFAINLALTGTCTGDCGVNSGFNSTPWTGGNQSGLPNPAGAMLLLELPHSYAAPFAVKNGGPTLQTVYPMAIREYWRAIFLKNAGGCNTTEEPDPVGTGPANGIVIGNADGSARFMNIKAFLGATPTLNEYVPGATLPGPMGTNCRNARSAYNYSGGPDTPNINLNAPLWGLGRQ